MRVDSRAAVIDRRKEAPRQTLWDDRVAKMELDADLSQYYAEGWELVGSPIPIPFDPTVAVFRFRRRCA
ncbi:MAG TPA: hypothetical protein VFI02_19995 [Armatimonadota bacterium]|nr:hypothetical protein [Armatimonadota bacterium]